MSEDAAFIRAFFEVMSGPDQGTRMDVHFNPASLQYTITNTLQQQGQSVQQYVSQSTGKLTMDLVFDTTHDGQDVRNHTVKIAKLMEPKERIPPVVKFDWGAYSFQGMVESYRETIDFFSPNGVPLRAGINLTLASQDQVFAGGSNRRSDTGGSLGRSQALTVASAPGGSTAGSASEIAARLGVPAASRLIAAANNLDTLRFPSGGSVSVSVPQAGVRAAARLNPRDVAGPVTDRGADFGLGGQAKVQGSSSLRADVGRTGPGRPRIRFEGA